jgi:hypothetical protein
MIIFKNFTNTNILLTILILFPLSENAYSQFLGLSSSEKRNTVEVGLLSSYFKPRENSLLNVQETIHFSDWIPYIAYRESDIFIGLGYRKFNNNDKSLEEVFLNAYYGTNFRITGNFKDGLFIPVIIRTNYLKLFQEIDIFKNRLEVGSFGLGTGLKIQYDFNIFNVAFHYNFVLSYSTINFSIQYGYSLYNELEMVLNFNNIFDDYGLEIGTKYCDERWSISDKKYNYFGSWTGGFIGINF